MGEGTPCPKIDLVQGPVNIYPVCFRSSKNKHCIFGFGEYTGANPLTKVYYS